MEFNTLGLSGPVVEVNWEVEVGVRDFLLFCRDLVSFQASWLKEWA